MMKNIKQKKRIYIRSKYQKGSVCVLALMFLLVISIVGAAWLPMLNTEATHARVDADEQQAWYAAEAGMKTFNYFKERDDFQSWFLTEYLNKNKKLSNEENHNYKLRIKDDAGNFIETSTGTSITLNKDKNYSVVSEGYANGMKRVITDTFMIT